LIFPVFMLNKNFKETMIHEYQEKQKCDGSIERTKKSKNDF